MTRSSDSGRLSSGGALGLTHLDAQGRARMVDVTGKAATLRRAVASGSIRCSKEAYARLVSGNNPKGDAAQTARIAGIMAGKKCAELIPLCHPIPGVQLEVSVDPDPSLPGVRVQARAKAIGPTGVEMEALTAASVALLTVYDMLKAADMAMTINEIRLVRKSGGRSGDWTLDQREQTVGRSGPVKDPKP